MRGSLDNHTYNLIKALSKKAQAVWRYDQYIKDAGDCEKCKNLWEKLKIQDADSVNELQKALVEHTEKE